jgi:hypothetical protein
VKGETSCSGKEAGGCSTRLKMQSEICLINQFLRFL